MGKRKDLRASDGGKLPDFSFSQSELENIQNAGGRHLTEEDIKRLRFAVRIYISQRKEYQNLPTLKSLNKRIDRLLKSLKDIDDLWNNRNNAVNTGLVNRIRQDWCNKNEKTAPEFLIEIEQKFHLEIVSQIRILQKNKKETLSTGLIPDPITDTLLLKLSEIYDRSQKYKKGDREDFVLAVISAMPKDARPSFDNKQALSMRIRRLKNRLKSDK